MEVEIKRPFVRNLLFPSVTDVDQYSSDMMETLSVYGITDKDPEYSDGEEANLVKLYEWLTPLTKAVPQTPLGRAIHKIYESRVGDIIGSKELRDILVKQEPLSEEDMKTMEKEIFYMMHLYFGRMSHTKRWHDRAKEDVKNWGDDKDGVVETLIVYLCGVYFAGRSTYLHVPCKSIADSRRKKSEDRILDWVFAYQKPFSQDEFMRKIRSINDTVQGQIVHSMQARFQLACILRVLDSAKGSLPITDEFRKLEMFYRLKKQTDDPLALPRMSIGDENFIQEIFDLLVKTLPNYSSDVLDPDLRSIFLPLVTHNKTVASDLFQKLYSSLNMFLHLWLSDSATTTFSAISTASNPLKEIDDRLEESSVGISDGYEKEFSGALRQIIRHEALIPVGDRAGLIEALDPWQRLTADALVPLSPNTIVNDSELSIQSQYTSDVSDKGFLSADKDYTFFPLSLDSYKNAIVVERTNKFLLNYFGKRSCFAKFYKVNATSTASWKMTLQRDISDHDGSRFFAFIIDESVPVAFTNYVLRLYIVDRIAGQIEVLTLMVSSVVTGDWSDHIRKSRTAWKTFSIVSKDNTLNKVMKWYTKTQYEQDKLKLVFPLIYATWYIDCRVSGISASGMKALHRLFYPNLNVYIRSSYNRKLYYAFIEANPELAPAQKE